MNHKMADQLWVELSTVDVLTERRRAGTLKPGAVLWWKLPRLFPQLCGALERFGYRVLDWR